MQVACSRWTAEWQKQSQYFNCGISLLRGGRGLMHGIKIPQQDFVLKMQEGAYAEGGGGVFAGRYGI